MAAGAVMIAANWRRAAVASPAAWVPWVLVGLSAAGALFGVWWTWGTDAAIAFLAAWWSRLLIGVSGAVALSVFGWWFWWRLPKRQVERLRHAIRDPKARTDVEDNYRKTIGQLLGGAAVLIGAAAAYLQFTQQQKAGHDLLISNQVSKGFDQLGQGGDDKVAVRLGGIYALEGVMNTSEQYHQPVLEALCAFVRDYTKNKAEDAPPATDVQAALTVIGRRKLGPGQIVLAGVHIPQATLVDADLSHAELDDADLSSADLRGANLSGAILDGADLRGAEGLTQLQLDRACGDEKTQLDPPLKIKPCPKQ
jgi:hypothetical protein